MFKIIDKSESIQNSGSVQAMPFFKGSLPKLRKYRTKKQTEKAFGVPSKRRNE